jgi:hypothetical protein
LYRSIPLQAQSTFFFPSKLFFPFSGSNVLNGRKNFAGTEKKKINRKQDARIEMKTPCCRRTTKRTHARTVHAKGAECSPPCHRPLLKFCTERLGLTAVAVSCFCSCRAGTLLFDYLMPVWFSIQFDGSVVR